MTTNRQRRRNRKGQILVLFLFFVLVLISLFALAVNVGFMARERTQMQVAADAAAMAGTRVQSLNLGFITNTNDLILWSMLDIPIDLAEAIAYTAALDFVNAIEQLVFVVNDVENIISLHSLQDGVIQSVPVQVQLAVLAIAAANGAEFGLAPENINMLEDLVAAGPIPAEMKHYINKLNEKIEDETGVSPGLINFGNRLKPQVYRSILTLDLVEFHDTDITEMVTAYVRSPGQSMFAPDFVAAEGRTVAAIGSSMPYYVLFPSGSTNYRSTSLGARFLIEDVLPGPWWQSRLVATPELTYPTSDTSAEALDTFMDDLWLILLAGFGNQALEAIIDKLSDKLAEELTEDGSEETEDMGTDAEDMD